MAKKEAEGLVEPEKAEEQLQKLQAQQADRELPAVPKGGEPGSHPLKPIDAQTAQELFFAPAAGDQQSQRAVWDTTAYGQPVLHRF